ncbi:MAG: DUF4147 domain-containing protein, partial [Rhodothermales bacterium]|nr:DUF4147 domain-containing protein [Rhodothermales bacterium]
MISSSVYTRVVGRLEADARDIFKHAISAVSPGRLVARAIDEGALGDTDPQGESVILACGKGAVSMASYVVSAGGLNRSRGLVTAPHSTKADAALGGLEFMNSAHPIPDEASEAAASKARELARSAAA